MHMHTRTHTHRDTYLHISLHTYIYIYAEGAGKYIHRSYTIIPHVYNRVYMRTMLDHTRWRVCLDAWHFHARWSRLPGHFHLASGSGPRTGPSGAPGVRNASRHRHGDGQCRSTESWLLLMCLFVTYWRNIVHWRTAAFAFKRQIWYNLVIL